MGDLPPSAARGLLGSLSNLTETLISIAQTRLALLSADMEEGQQHLLTLVALAVSALMGMGIGVVLAVIAIASAFWDTHRVLALALMAAVFLGFGISGVLYAMHKARSRPKLFASSLAELAKDRLSFTRR